MASGTSRGKKKKQQDSLRFGVVIIAALIILLIIYIISKLNENRKPETPDAPATPTSIVLTTETPTPKAEATKAETAPTKKPEASATAAPEATATPEPTAVVVPTEAIPLTGVPVGTQIPFTPTPTLAPVISESEAKVLIEKKVDKAQYSLSLMNDHLNVDGTDFFMYAVYEKSSGKAFSSFIIVSKQTKKIYYYDNGAISDFDKFPPDNAVSKDPSQQSGAGISADKAYNLLCSVDKEVLMLTKAPSEYTAEYDAEASVTVSGKNCYAISLLDVTNGKRVLRGEFFISEDGLDLYIVDPDTGEFIPIPIG